MIHYFVQYTNQADQDISMILRDFKNSISKEKEDYRRKALTALLRSLDLRAISRSANYQKEDIAAQTKTLLDLVAPGTQMLRTKFGHCIFFRCEKNVLTVIRVIDSREPYMVLCENILSLNMPDD